MGYTAGDLQVELFGIDNNVAISIQNTAKALSALSRAINKVNNAQFVLAGQKLENIFTKIASATNSINTSNLLALASAGKSLSAISRIGNLERVDFTKIGNGFNNLTVAITPFLQKVKEAEVSLTALYGTLSRASGKQLQGILGGATPKAKKGGIFSFLNVSRWISLIYIGRRFGRVISNIVQAGADYTESLDLWETAMGNNLNVATEFINKMKEAYGISEKTLMNAQAIFKNMLGSLGQISDTMAYALSEGVTQMALDYASLYNVTFENAFTKFQSALAGQVRPIRSVSGFDITENTIYQLYQSLGGTKTMRQLNRTEKQLLGLLAIFNQMNASGALGNLDKTMQSFANQSRVWKESLVEVKTWLGVILTYTIRESGIMVKLNAMLITVARYLEAVAKRIDAIQSFGGADPFAGTEESANNASEAIDKLQGKLLDFDKFRAMNSSEESALALDEKLLQALSGYDTILGNANNKARELSDQWFKAWGFTINANGELELTNEQLKSAQDKINGIINFLGAFDGKRTIETIKPFISSLLITLKEFLPVITAISQTTTPIILGALKLVNILIKVLDSLGLLEVAIVAILSYKIATKIMGIATNITKLYKTVLMPFFGFLKTESATTLPLARTEITKLDLAIAGLGLSIFALGISSFLSAWDDMGGVQKAVGIFTALAGALTAVAIAFHATHNWTKALGIGAMVAGGALFVTSQLPKFAEGGLPDKGTIFMAGEAGAEIVYNTPSGQSGVANVQQIEQAMYGALIRYGKSNGGKIEVTVNLDGEKVYQNTTTHAKMRGNVWSKA